MCQIVNNQLPSAFEDVDQKLLAFESIQNAISH